MTNDREFGERGTTLFSMLAGQEDVIKNGSLSGPGGAGFVGTGPIIPSTGSGTVSVASIAPPSPVFSNATVPAGTVVQAEDDAFTLGEDDTLAGNVLDDNGSGTDTAPQGTEVFVTEVNGLAFNGTVVIETAFGGIINIDNDGNIFVDPSGGYDFLAAGEAIQETFTYTLSGANTMIDPGEFEAVVNVNNLDSETGWVILGASPDDFFGISVAGAGDVNQDGFADLIIGGYRGGSNFEGRAYIVFGGTQGNGPLTVADGSFGLNGQSGFAFAGIQGAQLMGQAVGGGGDYNGDGITDFLIASPRFDTSGTNNAGSVDVIFGGQGINNVATSGFSIFGTGPNTYAGITTANAGDLNNDGIDDIVVGAWPADPGGRLEAGEVYVVFGSQGQQGNVTVSGLTGSNGFVIQGVSAGDRAGTALASAGDFNGDGIEDLIIGATHRDVGANENAGSAYVVFGSSSGFGGTLNLANAGFRLDGIGENDYLGRSVSSAGDINGDGIGDIAVGAFNAAQGAAAHAGAVYVVFGGQGISGTLSAGALNGTNGFTIRGFETDAQAGVSVSLAGDVNADGFDDLLIGAHLEGANDQGAAYVVFGSANGFGSSINLNGLDGTNGFKISGAPGEGYLGWAVAGVGDVNGDQVDDIAVSAFGLNDDTGAVFVIYGRGTPVDGESTATVTVTFQGENDPVVANDDTFTITEDGGRVDLEESFLTNDVDPDTSDTLTVVSVNGQTIVGTDITLTTEGGGTLTVFLDGTYDYTPSTSVQSLTDGETSGDFFTYTVTDGTVTSGEATVSLVITGVDDAPSANGETFTTDEDLAVIDSFSGAGNLLDNDFDPEGADLIITAVEGSAANVGSTIILASGGTLNIQSDGSILYFPPSGVDSLAAGEQFVDTATYTVSDGTLESTATVTLITTGVNDPVSATNDSFALFENDPGLSGTANVLDNDFDVDASDSITVAEFDGDPIPVGGSVTMTSGFGSQVTLFADGTFQYVPGSGFDSLMPGETQDDTFTYLITDGDTTSTASITVTVSGEDDAPVTLTDNFVLFEDDGSLFTFSSGSANVLDNDSDPEGGSLTVTELNGNPTFSGMAGATSADGADIFITSSGVVDYLIPASYQSLDDGESMMDSFTYTVSDGNTSVVETVNIIVNGSNDAPIAADDTATAFAMYPGPSITALANGQFSFVQSGFSGGGAVYGVFEAEDLNGDGAIDLSEVTAFEAAFTGGDMVGAFNLDLNGLQYLVFDLDGTLGDGTSGAAGAEGVIWIGATEQYISGTSFLSASMPGLVDDGQESDQSTEFATAASAKNVLDNDTDVDTSDTLTVSEVEGVAGNVGTQITLSSGALLTMNADGTYSYDPNGAFDSLPQGQTATETITYTVTDGDVTDTAQLTITIEGTLDGVVANNDFFTAAGGASTFSADVNDDDVPMDTPVSGVNGQDVGTGTTITLTSGATLTINPDGTFNYQSPGYFSNAGLDVTIYDSFSYRLDDGTVSNGDQPKEPVTAQTSANPDGDPFLFANEAYAYFGASVAGIGDINGDGIDDIAITAPRSSNGSYFNAGKVYVVFGRTDENNALDLDALDGTDGFVLTGETSIGIIGASISKLGDVNGDGIDDFGVGSGVYGDGIYGNKVAYVIYGRDTTQGDSFSATELVENLDSTTTGFAIYNENSYAGFGTVVSGAGDVNGDGFADILISSPGDDGQGSGGSYGGQGRAYVVLGTDQARASFGSIQDEIAANQAFSVYGYSNSTNYGFSRTASGAGDINGDGFDDIIIGASYSSSVGAITYVIFGSNSLAGTDVDATAVDGTNGFLIDATGVSTGLGRSVATAGDFNGDGIADVMVSDSGFSNGLGYNSGATFIIFGKDSTQGDNFAATVTPQSLDGSDGLKIFGATDDYGFGFNIFSLGDVNGDGFDDISIGTGYNQAGGRAYVIFGTDNGFGGELHAFNINGHNGTIFETPEGAPKFVVAGDINGDGFVDGIIGNQTGQGVSGYNDAYDGVVYVILGDADVGNDPASASVYIALTPNPASAITFGQMTAAGDFSGTDFDDMIEGSSGSDTINGMSGDDTINGMGGDDVIIGGDGSDLIIGGDGNNLLIGDNGGVIPVSLLTTLDNSGTPPPPVTPDLKGGVVDAGPAYGSVDPWVNWGTQKGDVIDRGPVSGFDPSLEPDFVYSDGASSYGYDTPSSDDPFAVGPVSGVVVVAQSSYAPDLAGDLPRGQVFGSQSFYDGPDMPSWMVEHAMWETPGFDYDFLLVSGEEPGPAIAGLPDVDGPVQTVIEEPGLIDIITILAGGGPVHIPDPLEDVHF
ncbi:Ig-like domain-containing protein [Parvularcula marina]|uniref:Ig-like domain-containing protein n=1 Tax=Parvularcula marina TaxID=2292771 RepID=UPI003515129A